MGVTWTDMGRQRESDAATSAFGGRLALDVVHDGQATVVHIACHHAAHLCVKPRVAWVVLHLVDVLADAGIA